MPAAPPAGRRGPRLRRGLSRRLGVLALAVVILVVAAFPAYWMIVTSLTPTSDLFTASPGFLPDLGRLAVYARALTDTPLVSWLGNSAVIAAGTAVLSVALGFVGAYALSRHSFRGRGAFGLALFVTQMMPEALLVVPLYAMFLTLGLLDQLYGLVLVNAAFVMPVVTWIMKTAIDSVPRELDEAATVDGAPQVSVMTTVVFPLVAPSVVASAVIAGFHGWNEYLFATTFIVDAERRPASVGLASFVGELTTPLDLVMATGVLYALPAVVFFMVVQRWVVSGLTAGGVKG